MKKIIIVAIVVAVVVGLLFAFFYFGKQGNGGPSPSGSGSTSTLPITVTSTQVVGHPTGTTFQIGTASGTVTLNNFLNDPEQVSEDQTWVIIAETPAYSISYYVPDGSFSISISQTPVPAVAAQAEAAFLKILGISQADACKLKVTEGAPYSVDPNYAGKNIGLSFCTSRAFGNSQ